MPYYEREEKYKTVLKGLKKLGLEIRKGKKHMTATCPHSERKTTLPRHKIVGKPVVKSIFEFLIENDYSEENIKKAFGWK